MEAPVLRTEVLRIVKITRDSESLALVAFHLRSTSPAFILSSSMMYLSPEATRLNLPLSILLMQDYAGEVLFLPRVGRIDADGKIGSPSLRSRPVKFLITIQQTAMHPGTMCGCT